MAVDRVGEEIIARLKNLEKTLLISPEALFEHPELARQIFEAVSDAVVIADAEGKIRLVNARAEQMFGYSRREIIGQDVMRLIPVEYRQEHLDKQYEYFQHPVVRSFKGRLLEGLRRNGERFEVLIALNPIVSEIGSLVMATLREKGQDEPGSY